MKFCLGRRGSVTPFFAIVLASIVFLNFTFYDMLRICVLKNETERKSELAANSALAMFDRMLEERYGIYCLREDELEEIENRCFEMNGEKSAAEYLAEALKTAQNGVRLNIMDYDATECEVTFTGPLEDVNLLMDEIAGVMKYKSVAGGVETLVEKVSNLSAAADKYDSVKANKELSEMCEEYKEKKKELENKVLLVNGFFDSPYAAEGGLFQDGITEKILPENVPYSEAEAALLRTAMALYAEGAFVYSGFCFDALEITEDLISYRERAAKKIEDAESREDVDGGEAVSKVKREILGDNFLSVQTVLSSNYRRLEQAKAGYNKLMGSLKAGDFVKTSLVESAVKDIDAAYGNFEKVNYSAGIRAVADTSNYSYGAAVDKEKAAEKFFGLCKNEIPEGIYEELPSHGDTSESKLRGFETAESLKDVFKMAGERVRDGFYLNDYIKTYFLTAIDTKVPSEHYLSAEIEYILCGKSKDSENLRLVYLEILAIRTLLNVTHILSDPAKKEAVEAAAEVASLVTEGAGKDIYKAVILLGWATAEGVSDMKRLEKGETVPFIKSKEDWRLSIDGLTDDENREETKNITGMNYKSYVCLLLGFVPDETKLKRVQDLLELNTYKKTNKYTKVSELFTGVKLENTYLLKTFVYADSNGKHRYRWEVENEESY